MDETKMMDVRREGGRRCRSTARRRDGRHRRQARALPRDGGGRIADPGRRRRRTGTAERYVREWSSAQAARGYLLYDGARPVLLCPTSTPSRSPMRPARRA